MTTLDPKALAADLRSGARKVTALRNIAGLRGAAVTTLNRLQETAERTANYIDALSSIPEQGVGVKALEWRETDENHRGLWCWEAGDYAINKLDWDGFSTYDVARGHWLAGGPFKTLELAKVRAQADYEARILSALVAPSHPAAVAVTDEVAIRKAIEFLGWVAESYDTHAKLPDAHPEEADAYAGSAEMARDHAKALEAAFAQPKP